MASMGGGFSLGTLWLDIDANIDAATKTLEGFSKDVSEHITKQKKAWDGLRDVADTFSGFGKTLTAAITVPLAGIATAALNTGRSFEDSFNKVSAYGDITGKDLEKLQAQALKLGKDTAFSAQQAADGMAVFASAGFDATKIYEAMPGTLNLAAAGQMKVADAAEITKDILGQFNLTASESTRVADVLAKAGADTSATLGDMATTLRYVGPQAHAMGLSIEEVTAMIIELDKAGIRGEQAGTGLRGMLGALKAPSEEARKALADLHVTISNADGTFRTMDDVLEQFKNGMAALNNPTRAAADLQNIFGLQAGNAAEILIREGGPALVAYTTGLENANGAADAMAKKLNQGLNYALDQMGGSIETAGIALSKILIPFAKQALETLTKLVNDVVMPAIEWFSKWPEPIQKAALAFAALAAAAGPLLFIGGQMAGSFVSIMQAANAMRGVMGPLVDSIQTVRYAIANDLTGALVGGEVTLAKYMGTLARFGPALGIAGIAIATFGAAIWATKSQLDSLQARYEYFAEQAKTNSIREAFAQGMKVEDIIKKFSTDIETVRKIVGGAGFDAKKANESIAALGMTFEDVATAGKKGGKQLIDYAAAAEAAKKRTDELADKVSDARKELAQAEDMARRGALGWDGAAKAAKKLADAVAEQDKDFIKNNKSLNVLTGSAQDWIKANTPMPPALAATATGFNMEADAIGMVNRFLMDNIPLVSGSTTAAQRLAIAVAELTTPAANAARALRDTGQASDEALQKTAKAAKDNYETLAKYYGDASAVAKEAWRQMIDAQVNAGAVLNADQQTTLARMDQQHRDFIDNNVTQWARLWQSLHDSAKDAMHSVNVAVVTGDWAQAKDTIIADLQNMGLAVLDKFTKPATDAIADFIATTLTDLLSGKGLGGVMDSISKIGDAFGGIFKNTPGAGVTTPPFAGGSIPGLGTGGGSGSGGGSAAGGIMGSMGGALGMVNMVTGAISAVTGILELFGVGRGGEKDRLNRISDATGYVAWAVDAGGMRIALLEMNHTLAAFVQPHIEAMRWAIDNMNYTLESVVRGEQSFSMNVYGTDPRTVAAYIGTQIRMQGGTA